MMSMTLDYCVDDIEICAITLAIALYRLPPNSGILEVYMSTNDIAKVVNGDLPSDLQIVPRYTMLLQ